MKYRIVPAAILADGTTVVKPEPRTFESEAPLQLGSLYFLSGGRVGMPKLFIVLKECL